ncbi:uncharacterized protein LOC106095096 [Stomoxys calcitrans]|uniref:uncharacterized protein LOC106095096 n=1 Tax=Stomoxys calcitrans TaxID=35570 RepID=UPI0027E2E489|nr:uncharacterized protein LOC106095096 [Stomoxys calcitrans]
MYVDDALVGSHSVSERLEARDELVAILKSAGFDLRKWAANQKELLDGLPRDHLLREYFLDFDDKSSAKTLGIRWNASFDSFYFVSEEIQERVKFSKREVFSVIARIFDPLGWLSPVVVTAKIIMQRLWLDEIGWDDELKPLTLLKWKQFVSNYPSIDKISIPRWIKYSPKCEVQLHGFCDSSELAYAAALYIRAEIGSVVHTSLLVSKSKVAPVKKLSLPRLELCGALLLAKLADCFLPQLKIHSSNVVSWTDSTIVLS